VLPLNIINEKIYVFLWFWFIIVAIVTAIQVIYRGVTLFSPKLREMLLKTRSRLSKETEVNSICRKFRLGDWFLLYQLGKNIDALVFKEFLSDLYKEMREKDEIYN
jgi:hypothetical protein